MQQSFESNSLRVSGWIKDNTPQDKISRLVQYLQSKGASKSSPFVNFEQQYIDIHYQSAEIAEQVKFDLDRQQNFEGIYLKCVIIEGKGQQKQSEQEEKMKKYINSLTTEQKKEFIIQLRQMAMENPGEALQLLQMYPQIGYSVKYILDSQNDKK